MELTPGMERRRSLPPGAERIDWPAADGWPLRVMSWPATCPSAPTILFANGRADFIEKYCESYWHWRDSGFGLMTFDWRGQGLSGRFPVGASGYFDQWQEDLAGLIDAARARFDGPLFLAAHSMGGHIVLRHLAAAGADSRIDGAILLAPMVGIAKIPDMTMSLLSGFFNVIGRGDDYAPGHGPYDGRQRSVHRARLLTSDPERFEDEHWWLAQMPDAALGGVTYRWLCEALASCRALVRAGPAISVPTHFFMGSNERLVDQQAAETLAAGINGAIYTQIEDAAHELLRERDDRQAALYARIDPWLDHALLQSPS